MNAMCVVFSTPENAGWNNATLISGDLISEVKRLENHPGRYIAYNGLGPLSYALMGGIVILNCEVKKAGNAGNA
jgi:hypothetical protein